MSRKVTPRIDPLIEGSGGKGGGGRQPQEAPNTLQSRSHISIVEVLSEGETDGIVGGLQGVYFDNTPVENPDGSYNFSGIDFEERTGMPDQEPIPNFPLSESITVINNQLPDNGDPLLEIMEAGADQGRVVVRLPQGLSRLDPDNGDLVGYSVGVRVEVIDNLFTGQWTTVIDKMIRGKTTRPYEEAYLVSRPPGASQFWAIRVRRTTQPADSAQIADGIVWTLLGTIFNEQVSFDDAAVAAVRVDSEATGGSIPVRSYLVDGIRCRVPTNYTPMTYTSDDQIDSLAEINDPENWNGQLMFSRCNDPAWICYDMLVNERYGLGQWVKGQDIDIYSFYQASLYNTQTVLASESSEPGPPYPENEINRFLFDGVLSTREDAYQVLQAVAASCRGAVVSNGQLIRFVQDRPTQPSAIINNERVVDGQFTYGSTEISTRFTSVNATFNDRKERYLPRYINEQAVEQFSRYGLNETEVNLLGCTNESQARRMARWLLYTTLYETESVEFAYSYDHAFLDVNDVITIADENIQEFKDSGIITNVEPVTFGGVPRWRITLDRNDIGLPSPSDYNGESLRVITVTGQVVTVTVVEAQGIGEVDGKTRIITAVGNFAGDLQDLIGQSYMFLTTVAPREYRIVSIQEQEQGVWQVRAHEHRPEKYDIVDQFQPFVDAPLPNLGGYSIAAPTNLQVDVESVITPSNNIRFRVRLNWDDVDDEYLSHYRVKWRRNSNQYELSGNITQSDFIIDDALPGLYEFEVWAVNSRNIQSSKLLGWDLVSLDGQESPFDPPENIRLVGGPGFEFTGPLLNIEWDPPPEQPAATIKDYVVSLVDPQGNIIKQFLTEDGEQTQFTITRENILVGNGGTVFRSVRVEVQVRDNINRLSKPGDSTFINPAPALLTNKTLTSTLDGYVLEHDVVNHDDYEGVKIWHATNPTVDLTRTNLQKRDDGTRHVVEGAQNTTYWVRAAAFDSWSSDAEFLNVTAAQQVTVDFEFPEPGAPDDPLNLVVSSTVRYYLNGTPYSELVVKWNRVEGVTQYDVEIVETGGERWIVTVGQPDGNPLPPDVQYVFNGNIETEYTIRVRSRTGNVTSEFGPPFVLTTGTDASASSPPSGFSNVTPLYQGALLNWTNPTDVNFSHTEVWRRQGTTGTGTLIATVPKPASVFFDEGLALGTTYGYRLRSVSQLGVTSVYTSWFNVVPSNVPNGSIVANSLAANSVTANKIQANSVTANSIGANQIITTAANIGDAVITTAKIQDSIQSDNFVAGSTGWRIRRNAGDAEFGSIKARGDLVTGVSPNWRIETTANDPTYAFWIGEGAKTDANGVFWVKNNGQVFINNQVFGIGANAFSAFSNSNPSTGGGSTNSLIATSPTGISVGSGGIKLDVNVRFGASASQIQVPQGSCTGTGNISGVLALQRRIGSGTWTTIATSNVAGGGSSNWIPDSDPSLSPGVCNTRNNSDLVRTFIDNPTPGSDYQYRVLWQTWNAPFSNAQVFTNSFDVAVTN